MISIILELKFAENGGCYTPKNKSHLYCIKSEGVLNLRIYFFTSYASKP